MRRQNIRLFPFILLVGSAFYFVMLFGATASSSEVLVSYHQPASASTLLPDTTASAEAQSPTSSTAKSTQPTAAKTVSTVKGNSLSIPSLGFRGSIITVGLTADNAIDVPAGKQIGYWNGSAPPGMPGAVFLDGHVDGIFANLNKLAVGQTLSMVYSGQTFNYRVVHSEVVQLATIDMQRALHPFDGAREGLNIMTCAGKYMPSVGTYDQRLVVYAVRVA